MAYDPFKDFIPVASLTNQPYVLVAGKPAGITTVRELIAAAKAKAGKLKFGSTGAGTGTHLGIVKFNLEAGTKVLDVPDGCNRRAHAHGMGEPKLKAISSQAATAYLRAGYTSSLPARRSRFTLVSLLEARLRGYALDPNSFFM
jgi:tripartite-type tricarboxylate transporter receptor subunit TctC